MFDRRDPAPWAVLAVTAVAVLVRVVGLGSRSAHWDEARVAYWILEYGETGVLSYRPIVHGPLLKLVNAPVFEILGATDAVMRLFVALVGGLLPLSALLFRHRLRPEAVVSLALFLAINPVLLYYSRFMRNDVLVGAFMFVAFALLVRAVDFRETRYLYPAAVLIALGFGAKENALAYLIAWVGAAVLLVDHRLFLERGLPAAWRRRGGAAADRLGKTVAVVRDGPATGSRADATRAGVGAAAARLRSPVAVGAGVLASFLVPLVAVYAPRGALPSQATYYSSCTDYGGYFDVAAAPTLGEALANPLLLPRLVAFTVGSTAELYFCQWITPRTEDPNPYVDYLFEMTAIAVETSWPLVVLAIAGFLVTRYRGRLPDDLVAFSFYWGAASLVGYPFITDIGGATWLLVHVLLPLSIPAAVALGWLFRLGIDAVGDRDAISVLIVAVFVLVLVGSAVGTGYATSFQEPHAHDSPMVQYAQPGSDLQPALSDAQRLAAENEGTDVLLYGEYFYDPTATDEPPEPGELDRRPRCTDWFAALPLPWYFEANGMAVECADDPDALDAALEDEPPVVVAHEDDRAAVDDRLDGYRSETHLIRAFDTPVVFYVEESR